MSKKWDENRWGPHGHCVVCGSAMPEGQKICSPECQAKYDKEVTKAKNSQKYNYLIIALMGASIIGFFVIMQLFPG
jgi:predicted nucleic acid-binding Zn ribbon protein